MAGTRRQHDEAALGARDFDGRVEHERQHFVEDAARSERAKTLEQRRHLPELHGGGCGAFLRRRRVLAHREHHLDVVRIAKADAVAVHEPAPLDALVVDERAEARLAIVEHTFALLEQDFGVDAGDIAPRQAQIRLAPPPDRERRLAERQDPPAEGICDDETRCIGGQCMGTGCRRGWRANEAAL